MSTPNPTQRQHDKPLYLLGLEERALLLAERHAKMVFGALAGTSAFEAAVRDGLAGARAEAHRQSIREGLPVHVVDAAVPIGVYYHSLAPPPRRFLAKDPLERVFALRSAGPNEDSSPGLVIPARGIDSLARWWMDYLERERETIACPRCGATGQNPTQRGHGLVRLQHPPGTSCRVDTFLAPNLPPF